MNSRGGLRSSLEQPRGAEILASNTTPDDALNDDDYDHNNDHDYDHNNDHDYYNGSVRRVHSLTT